MKILNKIVFFMLSLLIFILGCRHDNTTYISFYGNSRILWFEWGFKQNDYTIINYSSGGATFEYLNSTADEHDFSYCEAIFTNAGTKNLRLNDGNYTSEMLIQYDNLIKKLKTKCNIVISFLVFHVNEPVWFEASDYQYIVSNNQIDAFNEEIKKINPYWIDMNPYLIDENGQLKIEYSRGYGIHISNLGYAQMSVPLFNYLNKLLDK